MSKVNALIHLAKTYNYAYSLIRNQYNLERIRKLQNEKFVKIVKHAYRFVPFYRKKYDEHKVLIQEIMDVEQIKMLPIISKQDIRMHFPEMISQNYPLGRVFLATSSGSSGEPSAILKNYDVTISTSARKIRYLRAWNLGKENFIDPGEINRTKPNKAYCLFFSNSYGVNVNNPFLDFERIKNPILMGGISFIRSLIENVGEDKLRNAKFKLIITTGELLDKASENYIKSVFGTDILDIYALSEVGDVAWRCPSGNGYHIDADEVILEILDERGNESNEGEAVVTCLHNTVMPIIRYRTGDIVKKKGKECSCKRKLPLIDVIQGRTNDYFKLRNQKIISPYSITASVFTDLSIKKFKFIQNDYDSIQLYIVPYDRSRSFDDLKMILERRCTNLFGTEVKIEVITVNNIPRDRFKKEKFFISKVNS